VYNPFIFGSEVAEMKTEKKTTKIKLEDKIANIIQNLIYSMRDGERGGDLEYNANLLVEAFKTPNIKISCNDICCDCPLKKLKKEL
jgi:hypothetical protein